MKSIHLSYKFYILFSVILIVPASWVAEKIATWINTLPENNFFHYLSSIGAFEAPTTVAILFFCFWLLNNYIWKIPMVLKVIRIPNLNGRFEGTVTSSHTIDNEQNGTYPVVIEIHQSLTSIHVNLYTERSCSYSIAATLRRNHNENYELAYIYQNKTSAMEADSDMRDHHGTAFLEVFDSGLNLVGSYFNNPRERGRYGKISVKKVEGGIKGRFK